MQEVVASLSRLTTVRHIATFGSIAEGCSDRWSDVDLLVACTDPASFWIAASAIRAAKPVCFYRMFTGVAQPSGRYWFADESPFTRIDVSFYSVADYLALCHSGSKNGHPLVMREEYCATAPPDHAHDRLLYAPAREVPIHPQETEAGCCLHFHLEAVKDRLRGRQGKRNTRDTHPALARAIEVSATATFGGGDFPELARKCLDL
jgi:hypothetical protein